jgi:isopenicillin-N epimerase
VTVIERVSVDWEARHSLFTLDRRVAHLNHGSFGAVPLPVQRAQQRLRDELEANPMAFFTKGLLDRLAHTRAHLATFVHADPAQTALVTNATAAANAVLRSAPLTAGDEILVTDHGYGAVRLAAEVVAGRVGATVRVVTVPLTADDDEAMSRLSDAVREGRTRLAIVDQVASPTAKLFPVGRLVAELRRRGVLVLVDAAHAPGMLAVDVTATGADFWLGNLHKWAFASRPTALLAVAPEHRSSMQSLVVSWEEESGFPAAYDFAGTLDYTPWLASPTGVHVLRTLGVDRVREHNAALAARGQRLVAEAVARWSPSSTALDLALAGRLGSDTVSMRVVPLPAGVADEPPAALALRGWLREEHGVEAAVSSWGGRGLIRLSAQVYNRLEDYERLAGALRAGPP